MLRLRNWRCILCKHRYYGDKQCPRCHDWTCPWKPDVPTCSASTIPQLHLYPTGELPGISHTCQTRKIKNETAREHAHGKGGGIPFTHHPAKGLPG
ncbi:putative zinc ribbon protein [Atlantibacter hermannii]|uniref:putative zinc ribbon protein n=1 Tax=Atlantibacter hermannii TaxID=565 RepID=UPI00406D4453